jgi:transcriptional regulator with XRE-family HTH domain
MSAVHPVVQQLIDRRTTLGLTQRAVAKRAGIAPATISGIEDGANSPTLRTLEPWATALGLDVRLVERAEARS